MIDEYYTWLIYGYHSDDLKPHSRKYVVVVCDECGLYRSSTMQNYSRNSDLCRRCVHLAKYLSDDTFHKMSESNKGRGFAKGHTFSIEILQKRAESQTGKKRPPFTNITRERMSESAKNRPPRTYEHRRNHSASVQGVSVEEWEGFATHNEYCEKFDETIKEYIRDKYDRKCFVCGKTEEDNKRKLSVHHVDTNKQQGCDGHEWKLVSLCMRCHGKMLSIVCRTRIEYIFKEELK